MNTFPRYQPLLVAALFLVTSICSSAASDKKSTEAHVVAPKVTHMGKASAHHLHKKSAKKSRLKPALAGPAYAERADVMQAATDIAERRNLDTVWARQTVGQAHYLPQIARLIQPPPKGTVKNWQLYRSRFIDPVRINAGVKFWQDNRASLARAELNTGVPAEIIVGILGVETIYGAQMGNFRVIDALATLTFDFPASHPRARERSEFFKAELEQYLSLTQRTGVDPLALRGSYAGAMGMAQFMPSSWVKYAIDFDGDGKVDLFDSPADAIGSVANYFKAFNWQHGMPTHYPVSFDAAKLDLDTLLAPDILPTFSVASFMAKGAVLEGAALQHQGPLALIELQNGDAPPSYVAGTENFYAITRYNWSSYYALAVIELGQAVAALVSHSE
jgi:membrane-bound lytic murein transglycosylase B